MVATRAPFTAMTVLASASFLHPRQGYRRYNFLVAVSSLFTNNFHTCPPKNFLILALSVGFQSFPFCRHCPQGRRAVSHSKYPSNRAAFPSGLQVRQISTSTQNPTNRTFRRTWCLQSVQYLISPPRGVLSRFSRPDRAGGITGSREVPECLAVDLPFLFFYLCKGRVGKLRPVSGGQDRVPLCANCD